VKKIYEADEMKEQLDRPNPNPPTSDTFRYRGRNICIYGFKQALEKNKGFAVFWAGCYYVTVDDSPVLKGPEDERQVWANFAAAEKDACRFVRKLNRDEKAAMRDAAETKRQEQIYELTVRANVLEDDAYWLEAAAKQIKRENKYSPAPKVLYIEAAGKREAAEAFREAINVWELV
jgi:hypothetical protein